MMPAQTILIVDDDPICVAVATMALRQAGFVIQSAVDGLEALERLEAVQPDLPLWNIKSPNLGGFDRARRTRQIPRLRGIPMVALTAFLGVETEQRAYAAGFTGYLTKPINAGSLAAHLRSFLD